MKSLGRSSEQASLNWLIPQYQTRNEDRRRFGRVQKLARLKHNISYGCEKDANFEALYAGLSAGEAWAEAELPASGGFGRWTLRFFPKGLNSSRPQVELRNRVPLVMWSVELEVVVLPLDRERHLDPGDEGYEVLSEKLHHFPGSHPGADEDRAVKLFKMTSYHSIVCPVFDEGVMREDGALELLVRLKWSCPIPYTPRKYLAEGKENVRLRSTADGAPEGWSVRIHEYSVMESEPMWAMLTTEVGRAAGEKRTELVFAQDGPDVLQAFVDFAKTGMATGVLVRPMDILDFAQRYQLKELKTLAEWVIAERMEAALSPAQTLLDNFRLAFQYDADIIKARAVCLMSTDYEREERVEFFRESADLADLVVHHLQQDKYKGETRGLPLPRLHDCPFCRV